jgi:hypothetical protein
MLILFNLLLDYNTRENFFWHSLNMRPYNAAAVLGIPGSPVTLVSSRLIDIASCMRTRLDVKL